MNIYKSNNISMSNQKASEILNRFNDGEWDELQPYFNNIITFFKFVKKYGLLEEIDLGEIPSGYFSNEVFDYLVESDRL
jgi:hypothetical protein